MTHAMPEALPAPLPFQVADCLRCCQRCGRDAYEPVGLRRAAAGERFTCLMLCRGCLAFALADQRYHVVRLIADSGEVLR